MGVGYALNLASPHWFGPASWYVLHLLGLSIMLSPLLLRLPSAALAALILALILAAPFFQIWLHTPLLMGNRFMNDAGRPGSIFRLALFEGHFPVFPWLSFFLAGILFQRNISAGRAGRNILMGLAGLALGFLLVYFYRHGYAFATGLLLPHVHLSALHISGPAGPHLSPAGPGPFGRGGGPHLFPVASALEALVARPSPGSWPISSSSTSF